MCISVCVCVSEEGEEAEEGKSGERNWSAQYTKNRNIINLQAIKRSQKWRKAKGEQYAKKTEEEEEEEPEVAAKAGKAKQSEPQRQQAEAEDRRQKAEAVVNKPQESMSSQ